MISLPPSRRTPLSNTPSILGLDFTEFAALAPEGGDLGYARLFQDPVSPELESWARVRNFSLRTLSPLAHEQGGASEKFLFGLPDGRAIESVLIKRHDGYTACVSSQVGCAFACRFCASGQAGLKRNLTAGEIVEQVVRLGGRVNRIVFMGIGEPLSNYDNVLKAIRILRERRGIDFPTTGITVSTIGIPHALKRLREEHLAINLTISLHATTQETRDFLVPGARRHPLADVVHHALAWADRHNRTVTFAYLLLPGINDSSADAKRLSSLLAGHKARVNLMRWNVVEGVGLRGTREVGLRKFRSHLEAAGLPVDVRDTRGRDISAACGQLWLRDVAGVPMAELRSRAQTPTRDPPRGSSGRTTRKEVQDVEGVT